MSASVVQIGLELAALLFAVSLHESAHGWVAWRCGDPTAREAGRISLNPLRHLDPVGSLLVPLVLALSGAPVFGWARPVPVSLARTRDPRRAQLLVSAAGPASNLALAFVSGAAFSLLRPALAAGSPGLWPEVAATFLLSSVVVNLVLAVFNLLPVPPLDGFGVLESVLPRAWALRAFRLRRYGMPLLLLLLFTGVFERLLRPVLGAANAILFPR